MPSITLPGGKVRRLMSRDTITSIAGVPATEQSLLPSPHDRQAEVRPVASKQQDNALLLQHSRAQKSRERVPGSGRAFRAKGSRTASAPLDTATDIVAPSNLRKSAPKGRRGGAIVAVSGPSKKQRKAKPKSSKAASKAAEAAADFGADRRSSKRDKRPPSTQGDSDYDEDVPLGLLVKRLSKKPSDLQKIAAKAFDKEREKKRARRGR
jgi:hypothetical protein